MSKALLLAVLFAAGGRAGALDQLGCPREFSFEIRPDTDRRRAVKVLKRAVVENPCQSVQEAALGELAMVLWSRERLREAWEALLDLREERLSPQLRAVWLAAFGLLAQSDESAEIRRQSRDLLARFARALEVAVHESAIGEMMYLIHASFVAAGEKEMIFREIIRLARDNSAGPARMRAIGALGDLSFVDEGEVYGRRARETLGSLRHDPDPVIRCEVEFVTDPAQEPAPECRSLE